MTVHLTASLIVRMKTGRICVTSTPVFAPLDVMWLISVTSVIWNVVVDAKTATVKILQITVKKDARKDFMASTSVLHNVVSTVLTIPAVK